MFIEISWRGFTHWSMGICAGVCFLGIYCLEKYAQNLHILIKCILGAFFITLNEFFAGCIVNLALGWNVWDYTNTPFNVLGQVCLLFSFYWFLLCIPAFFAAKKLKSLFIQKNIEIQEI